MARSPAAPQRMSKRRQRRPPSPPPTGWSSRPSLVAIGMRVERIDAVVQPRQQPPMGSIGKEAVPSDLVRSTGAHGGMQGAESRAAPNLLHLSSVVGMGSDADPVEAATW
uniref:Uncharacterized protein n=1 Tax=Oryza punctata TaxID=4537 RepID=A0A0E0M644_ORYPU